jgi:hypothetical protein
MNTPTTRETSVICLRRFFWRQPYKEESGGLRHNYFTVGKGVSVNSVGNGKYCRLNCLTLRSSVSPWQSHDMRHRRQDVWRRHCCWGDIQITCILVKLWISTLQPLLNPLKMLRTKYKILPRTNSSVGIAHRYGLEGPRIESRWGEARFSSFVQTGCGAHPTSYKMSTGPFLVLKGQGRGVNHPPHLAMRLK